MISGLLSRARAIVRGAARLDVAAAFSAAAALARRRRRVAAAVFAALVAAAALAALVPGLDGSASPATLYGGGDSARATNDFHRRFGEEPILVLVRGSKRDGGLPALLLTEDLSRMLGLEGCLSGNLPPKAKPPAPACGELARTKPIQVVYGPGTFINESARQVAARFNALRARGRREAEKAARAARRVAAAQGKSAAEQNRLAAQARELALAQTLTDAQGLALRFGLPRIPQLNDPDFVTKLVFEPSLGFDTPKPRFAYLFPTNQTALIQARLRPGLSDREQRRAIALVREATASKPFRLDRGSYRIAGSPVVEQAVAAALPEKIWPPLLVSVLLLAAALALADRSRAGLATLLPALGAATIPYGVLALLGASLTLASLGVFPVVAGLGAALVLLVRWSFGDLERRATLAAAAAAVTVAGALSLLVSPVSIVRSFGALVALGLVLAVVFAFALASWTLPQTPGAAAAPPRRRGPLALADRLVRQAGGACLRAAVRRPRAVLGVALVTALAGWALSTGTDVQPRLDRIAPMGTSQVDDAAAVRRQTAFAGDVDVVVRSRRLASPTVLKWMSGYEKRALARHGYRDDRPCQEADLCPALSLTGLVGTVRSERQARADLDRLPRYFSRAVIAPDRQTANLAFRLRAMSPGRSEDVIEDMRAQLDPPAGVSAELTAQPAVVADTSGALRSSWLAMAAVLLASILLFLIPRRRGEHALAPLIPAALATGWSALVLFLLPPALNQLTASLAGFVVALTASLCLIVSAGYREQRRGGAAPLSAFEHAYRENGGVLALAGGAAVAGFVALLASDLPMLNDFGVVAAVDLIVVLVAAALVLPATLVWAEERKPIELPRSRAEAFAYARTAAARLRAGGSVAVRVGGTLAARARRAAGAAARLRWPRRRGRPRTAKGGGESPPPSVEP